MLTYRAPIAEYQFALEHWLDVYADWTQMEAFSGLDRDTTQQILEQAAHFCTDVLLPINSAGDAAGCRFTEGVVGTPPGYREAYRTFVEAGWPTLCGDPRFGGQGLPSILNAVLYEMMNATCHAWAMYPTLSHGAISCIRAHASEALQRAYLPQLISGEWLAAMCLTEAGAGSDLGLLQTQARPVDCCPDEAGYALSGTKIFISGGEHDLTDNIVHLVLARLPDAPPGTKGISLFLVPKMMPSAAGPRANGVHCIGIESKMGLHGSATCILQFEGARGWLVGKAHAGLAAMFVMMNAARVSVALQGIGHAEITHQNAVRHALERKQSRAGPRNSDRSGSADPIIEQPAIQRILLDQRATIEGERLLVLWLAHLLDLTAHATSAEQRTQSTRLTAFLTPVAKAMCTRSGFRLSSSALQVFGGYGYTCDTGVEQSLRDSRVAMIYEGTNEIQAVDLMQRKLLADGGLVFRELEGLMASEAERCAAVAGCESFGTVLGHAVSNLVASTREVFAAAARDAGSVLLLADDYLAAVGLTVLGYVWARAARAAVSLGEQGRFAGKLHVAGYFFDFLLPATELHLQLVRRAACRPSTTRWPL